MHHLSRRTILLGAAGGSAALAGTLAHRNRALAQAAGPIRIPYIVAMSGSFGIIGEPIRIGGEIAQAAINKAGGVNGRPIELIFRDDKLRPDETVGAVREFIGQGHRIMVAGLTGPTTFPLMPIMAETKTVLMTTAVAAIAFYGVARANLSVLVRYIPFSVMAGFLASTGWLMTSGARPPRPTSRRSF